jgi:hypothetical protein
MGKVGVASFIAWNSVADIRREYGGKRRFDRR